MGIRYYAYAFDADQTQHVMADPRAFIADDPLADAWGFEPGATVFTTRFQQSVPERDMLYLDKAWRELQLVTRPCRGEAARPAYRMFGGEVTPTGTGWTGWCRALTPAEMPDVARDLDALAEDLLPDALSAVGTEETDYAYHHLMRARRFVHDLVADGRGMAYLIG